MAVPSIPSAPAANGDDDPLHALLPARRRLTPAMIAVAVIVLLAVAVLVGIVVPSGSRASVDGATSAPGGARVGGSADGGVMESGGGGGGPEGGADAGAVLLVHVAGAVRRPGVYELPTGARIVDAIAAAGGTTRRADPAGLNLAEFVEDAEQVLVPRRARGGGPGGADGAPSGGSPLVDLNSADAATLDTLPGIGPVLSTSIVQWRAEHGPFASVDDLLSVPGIGPTTVEDLRDLVST